MCLFLSFINCPLRLTTGVWSPRTPFLWPQPHPTGRGVGWPAQRGCHEWGISSIWGLKATSGGTLRLGCTERQRAPRGGLLPCLDSCNFFSLTFAGKQFNKSPKNASYAHKEKSLPAHFLHAYSIISTLQMSQTCLRIRLLYFFQMAEKQLSMALP